MSVLESIGVELNPEGAPDQMMDVADANNEVGEPHGETVSSANSIPGGSADMNFDDNSSIAAGVNLETESTSGPDTDIVGDVGPFGSEAEGNSTAKDTPQVIVDKGKPSKSDGIELVNPIRHGKLKLRFHMGGGLL